MSFTPDVVTLLDENADVVKVIRLFEVAFTSATYRLAESKVDVTTLDGRVWRAGFNWIEASAIEDGDPLEAVPATYRIGSLVQGLIPDVLHNRSEWFQRPISQYLQFYVTGPVGPPILLHKGRIEDIGFNRSVSEEALTIRAETLFANRNFTPLGAYTDLDQRSRSPGDRGCEYVPSMADKEIRGWLRA